MGGPVDGTIVRSIYDAALDDAAWEALGGVLGNHLHGDAAVLWALDDTGHAEFSSFNHAPQTAQMYAEHFSSLDPWTQLVAGHRLYSKAYDGYDLIPRQILVQGEFYFDFLRKANILPSIGSIMCLAPGSLAAIGIHRRPTASPFKDSDRDRLQSLVFHLQNMLVMRRHLRMQRTAARITAEALHTVTAGMVICDERARLLFANAAAEALAAEGGIVLPGAGQAIAGSRPEQTTRLRAMVASAARGEPGGALGLHDDNGGRLLLVVSPLPGLLGDAPGRALVAIRSERSAFTAEPQMLIALFGLTPAEADLAWSLMQNESLRDIRARRGVSENTVRTQLARVLDKTGTANQRELVRLLALVPGAFDGQCAGTERIGH